MATKAAAPRKPAAKRTPAKKATAPPKVSARKARRPRAKPWAVVSVAASVEADLRDLAKVDRRLSTSALAASALSLAREIDNRGNSATSKSMCARALLDTMDRLRELTPKAEEKDRLDDLASRRSARVARRR